MYWEENITQIHELIFSVSNHLCHHGQNSLCEPQFTNLCSKVTRFMSSRFTQHKISPYDSTLLEIQRAGHYILYIGFSKLNRHRFM